MANGNQHVPRVSFDLYIEKTDETGFGFGEYAENVTHAQVVRIVDRETSEVRMRHKRFRRVGQRPEGAHAFTACNRRSLDHAGHFG